MISYWRSIVVGILLGMLLGLTSLSAGAPNDIRPVEKKVMFTIPACRMPGKPGALVYHRSGGFNETARGLAVSGGHIYLWDSTRLQKFDQEGKFLSQYVPPEPTWRMGAVAAGKGGRVYMRVYTGTNSPSLLIFEPSQSQCKHLLLPESTQGLSVDAKGHLWMSVMGGPGGAYEFDEHGQVIGRRPSILRSGPWFVRQEAARGGYSLKLYDERGTVAGSLLVPEKEYPDARLLEYYNRQTYLGVFGTEPVEVRSLTLYSISPRGVVAKIKLPARVLFGGHHRQLMPDGTKYYLEYVGERDSYQVVMERYHLRDLGLAEAADGGK